MTSVRTRAPDGVNCERAMIRQVVLLVACIAAFVAGSCRQRAVVYDGFETEELSTHGQKTKFLPGAVQIQSSVATIYFDEYRK